MRKTPISGLGAEEIFAALMQMGYEMNLRAMANDQKHAILSYFRDVLGIDSFAPTTSGAFPPQAPKLKTTETKPFVFIAVHDPNDARLIEMQNRMVAALKMNRNDFDFLNLSQTNVQASDLSDSNVIVVFGEEAKRGLKISNLQVGESVSIGDSKLILTHSLQDLEKSAAHKKETWTHLQTVF